MVGRSMSECVPYMTSKTKNFFVIWLTRLLTIKQLIFDYEKSRVDSGLQPLTTINDVERVLSQNQIKSKRVMLSCVLLLEIAVKRNVCTWDVHSMNFRNLNICSMWILSTRNLWHSLRVSMML